MVLRSFALLPVGEAAAAAGVDGTQVGLLFTDGNSAFMAAGKVGGLGC